MLFRASLLIAGRTDVNISPFLPRAPRARNVNPKNVNDVCSYEPRRSPSWESRSAPTERPARTARCSGAFYRTALYPFLQRINAYLVRWLRKKYKRLRGFKKARACWQRITKQDPLRFAHWKWVHSFWRPG